MSTLVRVVAPHFVAGLVVEGRTVVRAAPILRWMVGEPWDLVRAYIAGKGWKAARA